MQKKKILLVITDNVEIHHEILLQGISEQQLMSCLCECDSQNKSLIKTTPKEKFEHILVLISEGAETFYDAVEKKLAAYVTNPADI